MCQSVVSGWCARMCGVREKDKGDDVKAVLHPAVLLKAVPTTVPQTGAMRHLKCWWRVPGSDTTQGSPTPRRLAFGGGEEG